MHHERIAIIDYGSQYTRLITRRLRELGAFGLVYGSGATAQDIGGADLKGVILSGGPNSVLEPGAPDLDPAILELGVPILGICYGQQLLARNLGGQLHRSTSREYGKAEIQAMPEGSMLFEGLPHAQQVWMSHGDHVEVAPPGFQVTAKTPSVPVAAMEDATRGIFALQFHPEVTHSAQGTPLLLNFLRHCGMALDWNAGNFIEEKVRAIRAQVGPGTVVLGLSGGVDSSVAALLLHKAIGRQLTCVFVDHGLMRKDEMKQVQVYFAPFELNVIWVDASDEFLGALAGVTDPEQKRKIIGGKFIEVFEREAGKVKANFLGQGTTYPDVIESSGIGGAILVKSHHNVGGLPERMKLKLVEPLRELFKDEVRATGLALGLPEEMNQRHPFPGPGLAVRLPGAITRERATILQNADAIFLQELRESGWYGKTSQAFAVLLPVQTVGIMGDERTFEWMCALRAVTSEDFMTADWARLPHELLDRIAQRIVREVKGINRVVYDITSKPPATIEYQVVAKRNEPVRKSVKDTLEDLLAGHREAAFSGPESALKYLRRTFEAQASLPNAVKAVAHDLSAEALGQSGQWEACTESVRQVLSYLPDLEAAFPHEYRRMLEGLSCFERGIQAHSELGDFHAALELCERAMALGLGAHYAAKRDSLDWAR